MASDYYNVGIHLEQVEDFYKFAQEHDDKMHIGESEAGLFAVLPIDDNLEIWYYGDKEQLYPMSMDMYYAAKKSLRGTNPQWLNFPAGNDSALLTIFVTGGQVGFPLNVEIMDAFFWRGVELPLENNEIPINATFFAQNIQVLTDAETKEHSADDIALEHLIPCGTFPIESNKQTWKPSATAYMGGLVEAAELRTNPLTSYQYWYLDVSCLDYTFSVVAAPEYLNRPIAMGNYIQGLFWISGKIKA